MTTIWWINPVGTSAFDDEVMLAIKAVRAPHHEVVVRHLDSGPPHLEYREYEHQVIAPVIALAREAENAGAHAVVLGCFFDGGLPELRECVRLPVVGMGEASMLLASTLGHRFSIIAGRRKWVPHLERGALLSGMERHLASVRAVDMSIPAAQADPDAFFGHVRDAARLAVQRDGAEVIVLAEIAPPGFAEVLRDELGVAFVDPGMASWKWAEMMADLYKLEAVSHSKVGGYEPLPASATHR
ncbi:aspartate/glutamate racemase family protein [Amycolatopsis sp. EV170708-02-1]|uniref:aspartate/glutamate racemase family protein n=1 Tax=Amycolatopsis sp. EV170708-02-1 TaxID=2919322 RepID=UPI001F0CA91F|nr:aspartate/glutamate racemase family protein [Amycolatopsis sp. EV170708-02-1]UMP06998.1 aspartate/glutamate racemase family protein [Amycolatopsis sp. EV170708-02-1]